MTPGKGIAGIILAGGASTRMGTVKALLELHGETFADRLIRILGGWCAPVVMVAGGYERQIRAGIARCGEVTFVVNPNPSRGQLSSLQCGLRALTPAGGFAFCPVDIPAVSEATVAALAGQFSHRGDALLVIPRWQGRRGHPVFADRAIAHEMLELAPEARASDVIHAHRHRTLYVDVDDPGIVRDVDTPAEYRALVESA